MTAYRDDLEAAQLRTSDLAREVQQLRARNAELEQRRIENARRLLEAREPQQPATKTLDGRPVMLAGVWITAVVCAARFSAAWVAVLVSVVFLVIMALTSFAGTGSEDNE